MPNIEIEKARALGFCFGVRRAIKIIEKAAREQREVATLGPTVHNRLVVARLADMGVKVVSDLDQVKGGIVAITSHGVPPELSQQIQARQLQVIDTTCPTVRSAQRAAKRLAKAGFGVVIFGEANHPEVKGLLGWAGDKAIATMNSKELAKRSLSQRLGVLSQTTQSRAQFAKFTNDVVDIILPDIKELQIINTLCQETQKRQEAAVELAKNSDLMIVVGGLNSANTKRLAEVCAPIMETHLIETAGEIKTSWIRGKKRIGVTAGASTPDEAIDEVIAKLRDT